MKLEFTKMQALGNDYIYVYGNPDHPEDLVRRLSDRHFGVGSDGLILMGPSQRGDFSMAIYNADGSAATLCGNGLRCVGKYLFDKGYTDKTTLTIETGAGLRTLYLTVTEGKVSSVKVDMGKVVVSPQTGLGVPVDVGNPHLVVFVSPLEQTLAETLVLVSDGAYGEETERRIGGFRSGTAKDLSTYLAAGAGEARDDLTNLVLRLKPVA